MKFFSSCSVPLIAISLWAGVGGFPSGALAALLAYEPFTNAPGASIIGSDDGVGFSGAWQSNGSSGIATHTGIGLNYTDPAGNTLVTAGGAGFFQGQTTSNNNMQPIRSFNFSRGADGATTWISFLALRQGPSVAGSNPYPRGANVPHDLNAGNVQKLAVGNSSGSVTNTVGLIPQGSFGNLKSSHVIFSQINFIVVRIDHAAGANDDAYLFLNPALSADPSAAQADTNSLGAFDFTFDRLRVFAGGNDSGRSRPYAELLLDEYRLGETFADVTPHVSPGPLVITHTTLIPGNIVLFGTGGSNSAPYHLLASPILTAPVTNWPVLATNQFDASGNFVLTNQVADGTVQEFYVLRQVPPPVPMDPPSITRHPSNLTVRNAGHNGINIRGNNNRIEFCTVHDNGNTGLHITGSSSGSTFPSNNLILNCDAYLNYDPPIGGNADGFSAKWNLGPGNE